MTLTLTLAFILIPALTLTQDIENEILISLDGHVTDLDYFSVNFAHNFSENQRSKMSRRTSQEKSQDFLTKNF